jgi:hypothetical protein
MNLRTLLIALSVLVAGPAAAGDLVDRLVAADASFDYLAARDALVLDGAIADADLVASASHPDWRVRQQAAAVLGWRTQPELFVAVAQAQPIKNRADRLRYYNDAFAHPDAFAAVLERFLHRGESLAVREGLFQAMVEMAPEWAEVARGLFAVEAEPTLRVVMVGSMRKAEDAATAHDVLRMALADADPSVRAEAAVSTGWRADGATLADDLLAALADDATHPRAMAARALGWLSVAESAEPLSRLLVDAEPDVRLHALRSLRRLDLTSAKALTALPALLQDVDPRVSKQARKIVEMP